jgi:hypothetical protein
MSKGTNQRPTYCKSAEVRPLQPTAGPSIAGCLWPRDHYLRPALAAILIAAALPSIATASEKFRQEVFASEEPADSQPRELELSTPPRPGAFSLEITSPLDEATSIGVARSALASTEDAPEPAQNGLAETTLQVALEMSGWSSGIDLAESSAAGVGCFGPQAAGFGYACGFDGYHGDMNFVFPFTGLDQTDVAAFALALNDMAEYARRYGASASDRGDVDGNGKLDFDDVGRFWEMMNCVIPEPSSLLLMGCGAMIFMGRLRCRRNDRSRIE